MTPNGGILACVESGTLCAVGNCGCLSTALVCPLRPLNDCALSIANNSKRCCDGHPPTMYRQRAPPHDEYGALSPWSNQLLSVGPAPSHVSMRAHYCDLSSSSEPATHDAIRDGSADKPR
jgi:hypothetical protein